MFIPSIWRAQDAELIETFYPYITDYDVKEAICFITYEMVQNET